MTDATKAAIWEILRNVENSAIVFAFQANFTKPPAYPVDRALAEIVAAVEKEEPCPPSAPAD